LKHIPLLIVGATFAGLGYSSESGPEALVVEPFSQPGHEFISSYRPGEQWPRTARTEAGGRLLEELERRGVLTADRRLHVPAVLPIICRWIREQRLQLLLMTQIVRIAPHPDGYEVTLAHASGMERLVAGRIVDTTSGGLPLTGEKETAIVHKRINALLHCANLEADASVPLPESYDERLSVYRGPFASEAIASLELAAHDDWPTARRKLYTAWLGRPAAWQPWTIAAIADTFDQRVGKGPAVLRPNWTRLPSCAYANLLEALEEGVLTARKEVTYEAAAMDQQAKRGDRGRPTAIRSNV
jgi:hypothetical protein